MDPKYIFFNELELDSEHRFSLDVRENEDGEQKNFSLKKRYFVATLKGSIKTDTEIEKQRD